MFLFPTCDFSHINLQYHVIYPFHLIQLDGELSGEHVPFCRARAERQKARAARDVKRQRLVEDLERRERESAQYVKEEDAKARLMRELARIRQQRAEREAAARKASSKQQRRQEETSATDASVSAAAAAATTEKLSRTLKVSWSQGADAEEAPYDESTIRQLFSVHGKVEDVIMRPDKTEKKHTKRKKRKSALVVMGSVQEASMTVGKVHGDPRYPLVVTPLTKHDGGVDGDAEEALDRARKEKRAHGVEIAGFSMGPAAVRKTSVLPPRPSRPVFAAGAHAFRTKADASGQYREEGAAVGSGEKKREGVSMPSSASALRLSSSSMEPGFGHSFRSFRSVQEPKEEGTSSRVSSFAQRSMDQNDGREDGAPGRSEDGLSLSRERIRSEARLKALKDAEREQAGEEAEKL